MSGFEDLDQLNALSADYLSGLVGLQFTGLGEHWGEAQQSARAQQIQNPEAGKERRTVEGLGATTADGVTANYHERQQEQSDDGQRRSLFDLIQSN